MVLRRVAWLVGLGIVLGAGLSAWAATFSGRCSTDSTPGIR